MKNAFLPHRSLLYYAVDRNNDMRGVGGYWDDFAIQNGGNSLTDESVVGTSLSSHIVDDDTRSFVKSLFAALARVDHSITSSIAATPPSGYRSHRSPCHRTHPGIGAGEVPSSVAFKWRPNRKMQFLQQHSMQGPLAGCA